MVSGLRGSSLPSWSAIVTDYTLEYFHTVCACFDQERLNDEANNKYFRMFVMVKYSSQLPPCLRSYSIGMIACSQSVTQIDMDGFCHGVDSQSFLEVMQQCLSVDETCT